MEGAIFISRALIDSEVFASEKLLKIWIWLLIKANYKDRAIPIKIGNGQSVVNIKRGQLLFGRLSAEDELFIDGSTIYKCIKKLEILGNIMIESNSHYSLITICNYDRYQDVKTYKVTAKEQPNDSQVTTEEQPSNTPNKDNKDNKDYVYSKFYDAEIELSKGKPNEQNYLKAVKLFYGEIDAYGRMDKILSIKKQLTFDQFEILLKEAMKKNKNLREEFKDFDNYQGKYKPGTVFQSMLRWIRTDFNTPKK